MKIGSKHNFQQLTIAEIRLTDGGFSSLSFDLSTLSGFVLVGGVQPISMATLVSSTRMDLQRVVLEFVIGLVSKVKLRAMNAL